MPQLQFKVVWELGDSSGGDLKLVKKLCCEIFKEQLRERPDQICCTEAKDKMKLNQDYLKGICCKLKLYTTGRLVLNVWLLFGFYDLIWLPSSPIDHIHYRYFYPAENTPGSPREEKRWKEILGKLNDRIRYERRVRTSFGFKLSSQLLATVTSTVPTLTIKFSCYKFTTSEPFEFAVDGCVWESSLSSYQQLMHATIFRSWIA